ncbi:MAG: hypothetical protein ACTSUO_06065 [Candidatus Thorarchaeota archaeon]
MGDEQEEIKEGEQEEAEKGEQKKSVDTAEMYEVIRVLKGKGLPDSAIAQQLGISMEQYRKILDDIYGIAGSDDPRRILIETLDNYNAMIHEISVALDDTKIKASERISLLKMKTEILSKKTEIAEKLRQIDGIYIPVEERLRVQKLVRSYKDPHRRVLATVGALGFNEEGFIEMKRKPKEIIAQIAGVDIMTVNYVQRRVKLGKERIILPMNSTLPSEVKPIEEFIGASNMIEFDEDEEE